MNHHFADHRLTAIVEYLFHLDAVAGVVVTDGRHEIAHQHDAATAWTFEVLFSGTVGNVLWLEARTFVTNLSPHPLARPSADNVNLLGFVQLIAMLDGIDNGLFQRKADTKHVVLAPLIALEVF